LARDRDRRAQAARLESLPELREALEPAPLRRLLERPVASPSVGAAAVRASLPQDTLLLDYMLHRGGLSAFAATRETIRLARDLLRERELLGLCNEALFELRRAALEAPATRAADAAVSRALAEVASVVLWPLLPATGVPRTLAVVPVGPLARMPWSALPLPDGRLLCEAAQVTVVPGLRLGLASRAAGGVQGPGLIVNSSLGELENVAAETDAVARAMGATTVIAGDDATADRFLA